MTDPTQETPSAAPASAGEPVHTGSQGPRSKSASDAQRSANRGPRQDHTAHQEATRPLRNSAMADALLAATKGHTALVPQAAAQPQPSVAEPIARPQDQRPAAKQVDKPRSSRTGNSGRAERADRTDGGTSRIPRRGHVTAPATPRPPVRPRHPVVEKLASMYPTLFGEQPLPLKRGIFQDLLAAHPDVFDKSELKVALGLHTRSTRYLNAVAMGQPRHDLQGAEVEAMAPEHVVHALLEAFRRRKPRDGEDLQLKLRRRLGMAYMASNLARDAFLERVQIKDEATQTLLNAALQEVAEFDAKAQALASAFAASGKAAAEFADMYGMHPAAVQRHLQRAAQIQAIAATPAPAPIAAEMPDTPETP